MSTLGKNISVMMGPGQPGFLDGNGNAQSDTPPEMPGESPATGAMMVSALSNSGDLPARQVEDPLPSPFVVTPDGRIALRDSDPQPAGDERPAAAPGFTDTNIIGQLGGASEGSAQPSLRELIEDPAIMGLGQVRAPAVDLRAAPSVMDARSPDGMSFAASAAQLIDAMASLVDRNAGFAAPQFLQTSGDPGTQPVIAPALHS